MERKLIAIDLENIIGGSHEISNERDFKITLKKQFTQKLISFLEKERHIIDTETLVYLYTQFANKYQVVSFREILSSNVTLRYLLAKQASGNVDTDVTLAVDTMSLLNSFDHFILVSGDGDFIPLLDYLEKQNKYISVVSNKNSFNLYLSKRASNVIFLPNDFLDIVKEKDERTDKC